MRRRVFQGSWAICLMMLVGCADSGPIDAGRDGEPDPGPTMGPEPGVPTPDPEPGPEPEMSPDPMPGADPDPMPDADPDPDPAPMLVTCTFSASEQGEKEVNTWRGDVPRVRFEVPGMPDPAELTEARLRYFGYDADHPGAEGWIEVNATDRIEMPADEALDNGGRTFEIDVMGRTTTGTNAIDFVAFDSPEGAFFRISQVQIEVTGFDLGCGQPAPVVEHPAPAGVAAFAALSPSFPRSGILSILGGLSKPMTSVLLDFGPVYTGAGVQMFEPGAMGSREVNPAHLGALVDFVRAYVEATPRASRRHLQLYLLNGPGVRRPGYDRAYDLGPEALDRAVQNDGAVRAELASYVEALVAAVSPYRGDVDFRLAVALEDNMTRAGAQAVLELARGAGWSDPIGRNPCECGFGDGARVGDFAEAHLHSAAAFRGLPGDLSAPDSISNDGWGFTYDDPVTDADVVLMGRQASATGLWLQLWYDPIQGYPVPSQGPRDLRFDQSPARLLGLLAQGLTDDSPVDPPPTGNGVERTINYRQATYAQRRNWVLDCRDYAYTARFAEHRECDNSYNPDGSGHGKATFVFEGVIPDRYGVYVEGRHTENRNPSGLWVLVNGVEANIRQIGEGEYTYVLHGEYELSGTVTVVLDSTRSTGSDSVRNVRISPVR